MNRVLTPELSYGSRGPRLHFAHANGYPPLAYQPLLMRLAAVCQVRAMLQRPLWPASDPQRLQDWRLLAEDLMHYLQSQPDGKWIGAGHSVGANATLRTALWQPDLFRALILIDPVLFPPWMTPVQDLLFKLGLASRLHPMARGALRRRMEFDNQKAMFENYRGKSVFARLDDQALQAYVDALAQPANDGRVQLSYPPAWESRIYVTAARADLEIWRKLPDLKLPVLVLRGEMTDTFWERTAARFQRMLPQAEIRTIPESGHLLPLERPQAVARQMIAFLQENTSFEV